MTATASVRRPVASERRRYLFFGLAAMAVFMASIDMTTVSVAIPELTAAFAAPVVVVGWTLTLYQLVQVTMYPLAGRFSRSLGGQRVFLLAVSAFTLGSFLCAIAPTIEFLILFRGVEALGAGAMMPAAVGIVSELFPEQRARMIGLFTSVFPLGGVIGPNVGGLIVEHWSWRGVFVLNLPLGLLVVAGVLLALRGGPRVDRTSLQVDVAGIGLFAAAVVSLLFGMTTLGSGPGGLSSPLAWGCIAASLLLLVLFVRHVRRSSNPIIDLDLVARAPFSAANLYALFLGAAMFGFSSFVPLYAVTAYGMSALESGLVLTPRAITMAVFSVFTSMLLLRLSYRLPMVLGIGIVALGMLLLATDSSPLALVAAGAAPVWLVGTIMGVTGIGMGLASPAGNNAAIDLAPERAAEISGLRAMFNTIGGIIGVAVVSLTLSLAEDKALALSVSFGVLAGLLFLVVIPLAWLIPDSPRDRRRHRPTTHE